MSLATTSHKVHNWNLILHFLRQCQLISFSSSQTFLQDTWQPTQTTTINYPLQCKRCKRRCFNFHPTLPRRKPFHRLGIPPQFSALASLTLSLHYQPLRSTMLRLWLAMILVSTRQRRESFLILGLQTSLYPRLTTTWNSPPLLDIPVTTFTD